MVRTDIPIANQIVQVGHACLEAGNKFKQPQRPCHLVLLAVSSEQKLCDTAAHIALAGIQYKIFYEPDDNMGYTALCTEPILGDSKHVFRRYQLWHNV